MSVAVTVITALPTATAVMVRVLPDTNTVATACRRRGRGIGQGLAFTLGEVTRESYRPDPSNLKGLVRDRPDRQRRHLSRCACCARLAPGFPAAPAHATRAAVTNVNTPTFSQRPTA